MRKSVIFFCAIPILLLARFMVGGGSATAQGLSSPASPSLSDYVPSPEQQGGWRTLLPNNGLPDTAAR
jgi:hypothetical protein